MGPEQEILAENTVWNTFERMRSYSFFQKAENQAFRGPIQRVTDPIDSTSTFRFRTSTPFYRRLFRRCAYRRLRIRRQQHEIGDAWHDFRFESGTVEDSVVSNTLLHIMHATIVGNRAAYCVRRFGLPKTGDIVFLAFHRHQRNTADDGGRRERRYLRSWANRSDARNMQLDSRRSSRALCAKGCWTLRSLQRFPIQIGNRATHLRFHAVGGEYEAFGTRSGGISVDKTESMFEIETSMLNRWGR